MKKLVICLIVMLGAANSYPAFYLGNIDNYNNIKIEKALISETDFSIYQAEYLNSDSIIEKESAKVNNEIDIQNDDQLIDNSASVMGIGIF